MAAKILTGITHALVTVSEKADVQATGVVATVDFCYGPGDDSRLCQMQLVMNDEKERVWLGPMTAVRKGGKAVLMPVFTGDVLMLLAGAAQRSVERIKNDLGQPQFGKRYRVFTGETKAVEDTIAA